MRGIGCATTSYCDDLYDLYDLYDYRPQPQFSTVYIPVVGKVDPFTGQSVVNQTVVNQPVVERIIEREVMRPVEHIIERMIEPIKEAWYKKYGKELLLGIMSSIIVYLIGFR